MKRFSKSDNSAICNYCGKWQPTDLTNQQLEEMDWKCDQCKAKEQKPKQEPIAPEQSPESREVTKYDQEYQALVRLVKLLGQEGVPPKEMQTLAKAHPFQTVADVEYLFTQLWNLATQKYQIPSKYLIKKLPKNAHLKTAATTTSTDLTQFALDDRQIQQHFESRGLDVENVVGSLPNFSIKYIDKDLEKKDPSLKDNTNGFYDYKTGVLYINPRLSVDDKRITIIHEIEHAIQDSVGMLPVHTPEDLKQVQKTPYLERTFEMGARQQQFNALKARGMSLEDIEKYWIKRYKVPEFALEEVRNELEQYNELSEEMMPGSILASKKANNTYDEEWQAQKETEDMINHAPGYLAYDYGQDKTADGEFKGSEFSGTDAAPNPTTDVGPFSSPEDHGKKPQKSPFPNTDWLPADDQNTDEQPWSNVASSLHRPFSKKANPSTRYWIAPDGTEFSVPGIHPVWIDQNHDILNKYGINTNDISRFDIQSQMFSNGWVRISNEPAGSGFQIEVQNIGSIPSFVDDFIAKNFTEGDVIKIGSPSQGGTEITDPFPSIQKAVNKKYGWSKAASLKQADINGQVTNTILQNIHNSGGTTYNLSSGDMSGTPNFSVSIYPDREKIVDGVDFDVIEGFLTANEDLLKDPNNSLGAWTSNGKVYLDVVVTTPDQEEAIDLAKQNNQIAIWDLQHNREISTGGTGGGNAKAFSKKSLVKVADDHTNCNCEDCMWSRDGKEICPNCGSVGENCPDMKKQAEESLLSQEDQNEIAAASSPAYVIAVNNYAEALKRGHNKDRSLEYAIESVANIEKVDVKKLVEFINKFVII